VREDIMKVVLFCGGKGTRLGGIHNNVPKPMVKIGYRPIIWHIMKYYAHFGHKEFILCLGFKADAIKEYFINYNEFISDDFTMRNGGMELITKKRDLDDWTINFVDTGINSNIGERLSAVRSYLGDEDVFMANYADGLSDLNLDKMIDFFLDSGKTGCFVCVKPSQTFHVVDIADNGLIERVQYVRDTGVLINGGFFIFRKRIFDYMQSGEELVKQPFQRLIADRQLIGYQYDRFWCMDTFKEHLELNEMYESGHAPWEVWKRGSRSCNGTASQVSNIWSG
jgi:glucose-1-phosphate cytidylyltransferase